MPTNETDPSSIPGNVLGRPIRRSTLLRGTAGALLGGVAGLGSTRSATASGAARRVAANAVTTSRIAVLTGEEQTGAPFAMAATDLGIPVTIPDGRGLYVFGDTFRSGVGGEDWRSPVALYSETSDLDAGITWSGAVGGSHAEQLWPYEHVNGSTLLPADAIVVGDAIYLYAMKNEPFPNVTQTEIWKSTDNGATWQDTGARFNNGDPRFGDRFQCITWAAGDDGFVYIFSTTFGRRDVSRLYLSRVPVDRIEDPAAYQQWGWDQSGWDWGKPISQVLPDGYIGELSLRPLGGRWVLTFLVAAPGDVRIDAIVMDKPTDNLEQAYRRTLITGVGWHEEDHATGRVAQPYGGYIVPGSTIGELHLTVSQWDTRPADDPGPEVPGNPKGDNWPYHVMQFKTTGLGT